MTEALSITLTVDPDFTGTSITNRAEIANDDGDEYGGDIDSDPDNNPSDDTYGDDNQTDGDGTNDEDDHDPAEIMIGQVYDLALTKSILTAGPYEAGQEVTYEIVVTNQGTVDANSVEVSDYIPSGMSYDANNALNISR